MRLKRILLTNVRRHQPGLLIDDLAPGLNLIGAHNEEGKSSLLMALRCALFLSHGTTGQLRERLVPYGSNAAPEIELDFELGDELVQLAKSFKKDGMRLAIGEQTWRNAEAEAELERRLRFSRPGRAPKELTLDHLGMTGLFWVEQGKSFEAVLPTEDGQRRLGDLLAAEIGSVAGGEDADKILDAAKIRFERYWTAQGRVRTTGPLADAEHRLNEEQAELAELNTQLAALKTAFEDLAKLRAESQRVIEDDEAGRLQAKLAAAQVKAEQLEQLRQQWALKQQALVMAEKSRIDAVSQRQQRLSSLEEVQSLSVDLERFRSNRAELMQAVSLADKERDRLTQLAATAIDQATNASQLLEAVERQREHDEIGQRLSVERERHAVLTKLSDQIADLQRTISANSVTDTVLAELKKADRECRDASIALSAAATRLEFKPENPGTIWIDGRAHDPAEPVDLSQPSDVKLLGFGEIRVVPGGDEVRTGRARLAEADAAYARLLKSADITNLDEAEARARARRDEAIELKRLIAERTRLTGSTSVDEISRTILELESALAKAATLEPIADKRDRSQLRAVAVEAAAKVNDAQAALRAAEKAYDEARQKAAIDAALLAERETRRADLVARLENDRALVGDDELRRAEQAAIVRERDLRQELAGFDATLKADDPAMLAAEIAMHRKAVEDLAKEAQTRRDRSRDLEITIKLEGGKGLGERRDAAAGRAEAAAREVDTLKRDAAALKLLVETLRAEQRELRDRFTGPVRERLSPLLRQLLPDAVPVVDAVNVTLGSIERHGQTEALDDLSVGTREQLAVLVRLAFADLLIEHEGEAPPIILDDALVFADEDRFDRMKLLLQAAAARHQIIILSCRPRDYRGIQAKVYDLASCRTA